jgi:hypothetical protein
MKGREEAKENRGDEERRKQEKRKKFRTRQK